MNTQKRIILASQSPRRHELLKNLNVKFEVVSPAFDEKLDSDNYSDKTILSLSLNKALSVLEPENIKGSTDNFFNNCLIISADTVVVKDNKIFGKPKDENSAQEMLRALSGETHFVVTAISVVDSDTQKSVSKLTKTYVTFQNLTDEQILKYIKEKNPLDKAGAYGIQELGNDFIKEVNGDLENVIGLPTKTLKEILDEFGYIA